MGWGGVSFPQPTRGSGERCELPQLCPDQKCILVYLKATERSCLHLYADALSSSNSVYVTFGGDAEVKEQLPPTASAPCPIVDGLSESCSSDDGRLF